MVSRDVQVETVNMSPYQNLGHNNRYRTLSRNNNGEDDFDQDSVNLKALEEYDSLLQSPHVMKPARSNSLKGDQAFNYDSEGSRKRSEPVVVYQNLNNYVNIKLSHRMPQALNLRQQIQDEFKRYIEEHNTSVGSVKSQKAVPRKSYRADIHQHLAAFRKREQERNLSQRSLKVLGSSRTLPTIETNAYDPQVSKVGSIKASKAPPNPYSNLVQTTTSNELRNRVQRNFFSRVTLKDSLSELSLQIKPCDTTPNSERSPNRSDSSNAKKTKVLNYIIRRAKYDEKLNADLFKAL